MIQERNASAVFVGRAVELHALDAWWQEARGGNGRTIVLRGVPGIGASTLIEHFATLIESRMPPRSNTIVSFAGDPDHVDRPWAYLSSIVSRSRDGEAVLKPITELAATGRGAGDATVRDGARVVAECLGELIRLGPPGATHSVDADLDGAPAGCPMPRAAALLCLFDDFDWSDRRSSQAILCALSSLSDQPVLALVVSHSAGNDARNDMEPRPVRPLHARNLDLGGLSIQDIMALARSTCDKGISTSAARRIWEHTSGHPLLVRLLLEDVGPYALEQGRGLLPSPRTASGALRSRIDSLAPAAADLVGACSILGEECDVFRAAEISGIADVDAALAPAIETGLLEEVGAPGGHRVRFTHTLVRRCADEALDPATRDALSATLVPTAVPGSPGRVLPQRRLVQMRDSALAPHFEAAALDPGAPEDFSTRASFLATSAQVSTDAETRDRRMIAAAAFAVLSGDLARARATLQCLDPELRGPWRTFVVGLFLSAAGKTLDAAEYFARAWFESVPAGARDDSDVFRHPDLDYWVALPPVASLCRAAIALCAGDADSGRTWLDRSRDAVANPVPVDHFRATRAGAQSTIAALIDEVSLVADTGAWGADPLLLAALVAGGVMLERSPPGSERVGLPSQGGATAVSPDSPGRSVTDSSTVPHVRARPIDGDYEEVRILSSEEVAELHDWGSGNDGIVDSTHVGTSPAADGGPVHDDASAGAPTPGPGNRSSGSPSHNDEIPPGGALTGYFRAASELWSGHLGSARARLDVLAHIATLPDRLSVGILAHRGVCCAADGDWHAAQSAVREATALFAALGGTASATLLWTSSAVASAAAGDANSASQFARRAHSSADTSGIARDRHWAELAHRIAKGEPRDVGTLIEERRPPGTAAVEGTFHP